MKKQMTIAWIIAFSMISLNSCAQKVVTGNKKYITKSVNDVKAFKYLTVRGSQHVIYTQVDAGKPRIEIYGADNIVPLIETEVSNQTLTVKFVDNVNVRDAGKLEVRVFAPAIEGGKVQGSGDLDLFNVNTSRLYLHVQGSGDINCKGSLRCSALDLSVQGSGDVSLSQIQTDDVKGVVTGSGDITIKGTTINADYLVTGSGDITASNVKAESVRAVINGSGDISCHAEKSLTGNVRGSGDVRYKGNPDISFPHKGLSKMR